MVINQNRTRQAWITLLTKENYQTVATIQAPMKHIESYEGRIEQFAKLSTVNGVFYSVERNADLMGYHIHLMFNAYNCNKEKLSFAIDTKPNYIPYYESVTSPRALAGYVTKYMGKQIHYNFYA
jgi:hypothetical protein